MAEGKDRPDWIGNYGQMLILTRRLTESIHIDNDTVVTVLGIDGNTVRLGISAPRQKEVHRTEVWERIQKERQLPQQADIVIQLPKAPKGAIAKCARKRTRRERDDA